MRLASLVGSACTELDGRLPSPRSAGVYLDVGGGPTIVTLDGVIAQAQTLCVAVGGKA